MPPVTLTSLDWALAAPLLWLAGTAVLLLLADAIRPQRINNLAIALAGILGACIGLLPLFAEVHRSAGELSGFSGMLRVSAGSLVLALLCLGSAAATGFLAWSRLDRYEEGRHSTALWTLLLITPIGMLLALWADHVVVLFLGIETLSLPLYALAALRRREDASIEAGLKYFLLGAFASGFLAFGMACLYAGTGSLTTAAVPLATNGGVLAQVGLGMLLTGLLFKAGAVPFHLWVADVYQGAPTPITALMAAGTKAAAFGALIRWLPEAGVADAGAWVALGLLTLLVANFAALPQSNLKRLLALSGVAHAGILFLALGAQVSESHAPVWDTVVFYLVAYGLAALAAFGALELAERHSGGTSDGDRLRGIARREPLIGAALCIAVLSLAGVPLTAGFLAKYFVFVELVRAGLWVWALVGVLLTLVAFAYYLRALVTLFMLEPENEGKSGLPSSRPDFLASAAVAVPAALSVILGLWPGALLAG